MTLTKQLGTFISSQFTVCGVEYGQYNIVGSTLKVVPRPQTLKCQYELLEISNMALYILVDRRATKLEAFKGYQTTDRPMTMIIDIPHITM